MFMAINSKKKGARAERKWAEFCREHGYEKVRRTAQFCGNTGEASDCVGLEGIHQECKAVERLNIVEAMNQAVRDSTKEGEGNLPIVAHKRNRTPWYVTMLAEDWFKIYSAWKPPSQT